MIIRNNVKWFDWQRDVIRGVLSFPHDIHVVKASRQKGKSVMAESIILKFAIDYKNSFSLYVSPTLKQARKVFKEINKAIKDTFIFSKSNESLLEIQLKNGSFIQFASAEQGETALQGYTVSGIMIIDEAAFIPDDIYFAVAPMVDANSAPTLIISTPQFKKGFFYDTFVENSDTVHSYDWCDYDTSAILPESKLQYYKKKLPEIKFRQYYLGQFCDINTESTFGDFRKILSNDIAKPWVAKNRYDMPTPTDNYFCHMGIDWGSGSGQDETAIVIFNNLKQQAYIEHFSDLDTTQTINRICELIKIWKPKKVVAEVNGIGKVYYDLLRKAINNNKLETALKSFTTTNDSKNRIISQLQVAIQNNDIQLLDDNYQTEQLSQYLPELTKTGKVTFNAASGYHDDLVMANAICFDSLCTKSYTIL